MMLILKGLAKMDGQGDLYDYSFDDVCKNTMIMMIMMNTTRGLGKMDVQVGLYDYRFDDDCNKYDDEDDE